MSHNLSPKFFMSTSHFLSPSKLSIYKPETQPGERAFIGETAPNSSMRDVLLLKCKSAIEELHHEIEDLQKAKLAIEEKNGKLEKEIIERDNLFKQERYFKEKLEEEVSELKANFLSVTEKSGYLEDKLRNWQETEMKYEDLKRNFQMLCETNEDLKERLEDQIRETTRRDNLSKEWEETLTNVNQNIRELNQENEGLKSEREDLCKRIESLQTALEETESVQISLDKQLELVDKLRSEIQQVQVTLLERTEEVSTERKENERLRKLVELTDGNLRDQLREQERVNKTKVTELEALLSDKHKADLEHFKEDMMRSIEKMERIKAKTDEDLNKLREEKDALKQDCRALSEKLVVKDNELRDLAEKSKKRSEDLQREQGKMQKIIEDQNDLITKLEKVIEKERGEKSQIQKESDEAKESLRQLIEKNAFLTEKLKASHQEIENISKDVRKTFENEDEKNLIFHKRIRELEALVAEKEKNYDVLNKEYLRVKANVKKLKADLATAGNETKQAKEEATKAEAKLFELSKENEDLKAKHNEFQEALKDRMDEFSNDLKVERDHRMQEQKYARELEDKLMTIENQYKSEIGFLKTELLRKERECEKLKIKHDDLNFNLITAQNKIPNTGTFSVRDEVPPSSIERKDNRLFDYEKPEKELNEMKGQIESFENVALKNHLKRQMNEDRKDFSLNQRVSDPLEFVTSRNNNSQSREFIDRFKGIINKLEDKLSKMSYELKMSDSFAAN